MKLSEFVECYISSRDISNGYSDQLRWLAKAIERSAQRIVLVSDLQIDFINRHLRGTRDRLTPETRKSHRRMILTLWHAAADAGLVDQPIRRKIMQIRVPDKLHKAWTVNEVRLLLVATDKMTGYHQNGVQKRLYWRAYVLAAWDSGLRGCDLRRITRNAIRNDGRCVLVQNKTGRFVQVFFRRETMDAIVETFPPQRNLIWPLWGRLELWRREASRLVKIAGLTGSIGQIRHSSGTDAEIHYPGRGHEHLGNSRAVFERHYLDRMQIPVGETMPERLV